MYIFIQICVNQLLFPTPLHNQGSEVQQQDGGMMYLVRSRAAAGLKLVSEFPAASSVDSGELK